MWLLGWKMQVTDMNCSVASLCRKIAARLGYAYLSSIALVPILNPNLDAETRLIPSSQSHRQGNIASTAKGRGFCEICSAHGALGRFPGREVMGVIKEYMRSYSSYCLAS